MITEYGGFLDRKFQNEKPRLNDDQKIKKFQKFPAPRKPSKNLQTVTLMERQGISEKPYDIIHNQKSQIFKKF